MTRQDFSSKAGLRQRPCMRNRKELGEQPPVSPISLVDMGC